jgi:23S rRNA (guanine745-N1)-methyltransferase
MMGEMATDAGTRALDAVAPFLRCPVCGGGLRADGGGPVAPGRQLRCGLRHSFNVARQGYVSLTSGRGGPGTGDSAAMVMARDEFLRGGHYRPVADAVAALAGQLDPPGPGLVADLAGGTGYYLARVLDDLPGAERAGVCVDLSAPALRRAARAHPRAAAVGADAWQPLPLADASAALVLSVFGPRNPAEIERLLAPGGGLIVASPGPRHHQELRRALGLIGIDSRKEARLAAKFGRFGDATVTAVRYQAHLDHPAVTSLAAMGPSARHVTRDELAARVAALPEQVAVTVDVEVRSYRAA